MGSNWETVKLEDISTIIDSRHKTPQYSEHGYPMVRVVDVSGGKLSLDNTKRVSDEVYRDFSKGRDPELEDIIITRVGSYGNVAYVSSKDKFCLGQNTALIIPKEKDRFLYYSLISPQIKRQIEEMVVGAVQKTISLKDIKSLEVKLPPKKIKARITSILSVIDEKIEINKSSNQTLEQIAQVLFKSWFVDFDPVIDNALAAVSEIPNALQHRVEIRKKAHALQKQKTKIQPLPASIQRLFPSEFENCGDNTLGIQGWIPKGWKSDVLASIAELSTSRMDGAQLTLENYISTENMLPYKQGVTKASSIPQLKTTPSFKAGQVLISNIRPYFKKIWLANRDGGRSNDVLGFQSIEPRTESYLMNLLSQDSFFDFMMTTAKGSKMPRGDKKAIMNWGVVVPPVQIREFYSRLVRDFYIANSNRVKESNSLVQLRDILLPKLISGELLLNKDIENG